MLDECRGGGELPGGLYGEGEALDGVFDCLDRGADQASREDMNTVALARVSMLLFLFCASKAWKGRRNAVFFRRAFREEKLAIVDT